MKLDIPEGDRELLRRWLLEPNDQTEKILVALEHEEPALQRSVLTKRIAASVGLDEESIRSLLAAFFNMSNGVALLESAHKDHASEIVFNSIVNEPTAAEKREAFEARVKRVLQSKSIEITAKALSVMIDNQNSFCFARTLSEMRPVFTEDGLDPKAAVIVHQLKIAFHTGPERRLSEVFVALDRSDLESMKQVLDRALQKHSKLAEQAKQLELPLLEEAGYGN